MNRSSDNHRLHAPGACDNGAGVAGMLAVAAALGSCGIELPGDLLFAGNVGEEGEGDLRGMRYLYGTSPWRERIAANVVLDGAGCDLVVTQALGSRRFLVTIQGPGGHSWTDSATPNSHCGAEPCHRDFERGRITRYSPPCTTLNVGTIEGGSSVNATECARARFDLRSVDREQLIRLEVELHRAVEDAVLAANEAVEERRNGGTGRGPLRFDIKRIGDRPAGSLADDAPLLESLRAVDRHLSIRAQTRVASTDANIPLSLGIPALSIGAGGKAAESTREEWYDAPAASQLKRILLLLLLLLDQLFLAPSAAGSSAASPA